MPHPFSLHQESGKTAMRTLLQTDFSAERYDTGNFFPSHQNAHVHAGQLPLSHKQQYLWAKCCSTALEFLLFPISWENQNEEIAVWRGRRCRCVRCPWSL